MKIVEKRHDEIKPHENNPRRDLHTDIDAHLVYLP